MASFLSCVMADQLDTFGLAFNNMLKTRDPRITDVSVAVSGMARCDTLDGRVLYSVSIYVMDPGMSVISPRLADSAFRGLAVEGFSYFTSETLLFESGSKVPDPKWRIQLKYLKTC